MGYDLIKKISIGDYATISLHLVGAEKWEVRTIIGYTQRGHYVFGDEKQAEKALSDEHAKVIAEMKRKIAGSEW